MKIGKKGKNTKSKQASYRKVDCPACHVKAGEYCKSMGLRGRVAGNIMGTSCHDLRIKASGNVPRSVLRSRQRAKVAATLGTKRHQAGKKAWRTRLRNAGNQAYQEASMNGPALTPYELVADVLETLRVKPELEGAGVSNKHWSVSALRTTHNSISIGVVELKG